MRTLSVPDPQLPQQSAVASIAATLGGLDSSSDWRIFLAATGHVVAGLLSIPAVFLVSLWYFWRMVQAEYASGVPISTDGDTVTIPAVGVTATWSVLLLAGVGVFLVMRIVRKGKRGAAVEQADEADDPAAGTS